MKVLIDTCIWSLAFRRQPKTTREAATELAELIREFRACMIGPVRQELLSGIRNSSDYEKLRDRLHSFPDVEIVTEDYEQAAAFLNICRKKGVQGSNTDFLICAIAARPRMSIFTVDDDFRLFAKHLPVTLHRPRTRAARR